MTNDELNKRVQEVQNDLNEEHPIQTTSFGKAYNYTDLQEINREFDLGRGKGDWIGMANYLAREVEIKYASVNGRHGDGDFYYWDGVCWHRYRETDLTSDLGIMYGSLCDTQAKCKHVMFNLQKGDRSIDIEKFDRFEDVIICRGQVIRVVGGKLVYNDEQDKPFQHNRQYLNTYYIDAAVDPSPHPYWDEILQRVFNGDQTGIQLFQEMMGCLLLRNNYTQTFFYLQGKKNSGKSTAQKILEMLIGTEKVSAIKIDKLENDHYPAALVGKHLNFSPESKRCSQAAEEWILSLTAADKSLINQKNQAIYSGYLCEHLAITSNDPIAFANVEGALSSRCVLIPFMHNVESGMTSQQVTEKLRAEKNQIFTWALQGLGRVLAKKTAGKSRRDCFTKWSPAQEVWKDVFYNSNPVVLFLDDQITVTGDPEHWESKEDVYLHYRSYASKQGFGILHASNFWKTVYDLLGQLGKRSKVSESKVRQQDGSRQRRVHGLQLQK